MTVDFADGIASSLTMTFLLVPIDWFALCEVTGEVRAYGQDLRPGDRVVCLPDC